MTKIAICSDLHCDFTNGKIFSIDFLNNKQNADVLCLLGDTFEIRNCNKFKWLFDSLTENYPVVLFLYVVYSFIY